MKRKIARKSTTTREQSWQKSPAAQQLSQIFNTTVGKLTADTLPEAMARMWACLSRPARLELLGMAAIVVATSRKTPGGAL